MCLTIRQNELRLGRQRISSLEEWVFKMRLLTSLTISFVVVEGESKK
jgi:hypothetical protein